MERPEKGSALDLPYLVGFYYPTTGLGLGGKQGRDSFSLRNFKFISQAHTAIPKRKQLFKMS